MKKYLVRKENEEKEMNVIFPLRLQFFAEGGDGSGGGEGSEDDEDGDEDGEEEDDEGGKKKKKSQKVSFEQAELTRMMANEKKQGRLAVLKELGIDTDDVKSNKDAMEKFRKWQKDQRTDLENAHEELKEMQKVKNANSILEAKVEALALGAKPESLDDLIALAIVKTDEDNDIKKVMEDMKSKYPMFFKGNDSNEEDEDEDDDDEKQRKMKGKGTGRTLGAGNKGKGGKTQSFAERYAERKKAESEGARKSSYFRT